MKDLSTLFRQTGKTNLVTSMVEAIQNGYISKADIRKEFNTSILEDIEYFQKKVWSSLGIPKHYLFNEPDRPSFGSIRTEGKFDELQVWQGTEWTNLKGRTVSDEGYFYAPYIPYIKNTYINDVKVERSMFDDNVLELDVYITLPTPVEYITLTVTVGESPSDAYDRAMKVVE